VKSEKFPLIYKNLPESFAFEPLMASSLSYGQQRTKLPHLTTQELGGAPIY